MPTEVMSIRNLTNPDFLRRLRTIQSHAHDESRAVLESNVYCLFLEQDPAVLSKNFDAIIWANMILTQDRIMKLEEASPLGKYLVLEDSEEMQSTSWGMSLKPKEASV